MSGRTTCALGRGHRRRLNLCRGSRWNCRSQAAGSKYKLWTNAREKKHSAGATYWEHVTNEASLLSWALDKPDDSLMSIETLASTNEAIDIKTFAQTNPEKTIELLSHMRVEFLELFLEYYLLEKPQAFLGDTHGCIQTRIWQTLRIVEQALGAFLILGTTPDWGVLFPILEKSGLEQTPYGSLTHMILLYAETQDYSVIAERFKAPVPAIRKIFRPVIEQLLAAKNIREVAVGCYLRHLTHQVSLTGAGLSRRAIARLKRVKSRHFHAPALDESPLLSFNRTETLADTPWVMLEISSDHRMTQITPLLKKCGKQIFGKVPAQIFAPVDAQGDLLLGYIFARSLRMPLAYKLRSIRGITEFSATCDDTGRLTKVITVPNIDLQPVIHKTMTGNTQVPQVHIGDFVEILTGDAAKYCGTIEHIKGIEIHVTVNFPSGRVFHVIADPTVVKLIPDVPLQRRAFWGINDPALLR
jgi:hypothetical protein